MALSTSDGLARQLGLFGAEQAAGKADPDWLYKARVMIRIFAHKGAPFTSDDILSNIPPPPKGTDPRALGAAFHELSNEGLIVATGRWVASRRKERHGGPVREWR